MPCSVFQIGIPSSIVLYLVVMQIGIPSSIVVCLVVMQIGIPSSIVICLVVMQTERQEALHYNTKPKAYPYPGLFALQHTMSSLRDAIMLCPNSNDDWH